MSGDPISAVATLLSQAFGFAVDADGFAKLSREHQLKWIQRGMNDAIANGDRATADALFGEYRELYQQT